MDANLLARGVNVNLLARSMDANLLARNIGVRCLKHESNFIIKTIETLGRDVMPLNLRQSNDHEQTQSSRDRERTTFQPAWFIPSMNFMNEFVILNAQLDAAVRSDQAQLEIIFMTNAPGYFDTQLLKQLLIRSNVQKIIVHVRAHSFEHERQRIISSVKTVQWWCDDFLPKLKIWMSDFAWSKIELSLQQWKDLIKIDTIIHNDASVHWNLDHHALKTMNVISTLKLFMLIDESDTSIKFVYVSEDRHFDDKTDDNIIVAKLTFLEDYNQFKFVVELLMKHFAQQPTKTNQRILIIKPELIIETINEKIANIDDFIWKLAANAISIKSYTKQNTENWLCVSSAKRIVKILIDSLTKLPDENRRNSNIINNIFEEVIMYEFWNILNAKFNYQFQPIPFREWVELLRKNVEIQKKTHSVWLVFHVFKRENKIESKQPSKKIPTENSETIKIIIAKNVDFLIEIGFLAITFTTNSEFSDEESTSNTTAVSASNDEKKISKYDMVFKRRRMNDIYE